jgi:plastocyanin
MKKIVFLALAAVIALAACGGGGGDESASSSTATTTSTPAPPPVDPATAGTITGTITLAGDAPEMDTIQMGADPNCARMHSSPVMNEFVITGEGGTLANAFVYVKSGLEGRTFPPPSESVLLDQEGCVYVPHVVGLQVGQTLTIRNSDETLHNIHAMPTKNPEFNIGQPVKGLTTEKTFEVAEVMIPFKCDVHKWMNSYAGVLDHPYFAVTQADGSYSIPNLPPGDYVVEVWHERLGTQEASVTVGESATVENDFSYSGEAAGE